MPPAKRRGRSLWLILPVLSIALAIWACGASVVATSQPPSNLWLEITFHDQYYGIAGQPYGPPEDTSYVRFEVTAHEGHNTTLVSLSSNTSLTCNGLSSTLLYAHCPRQPPGGTYQITYTDAHGRSATITLPVPAGSFGLGYPDINLGATLTIPSNGILAIPYTAPIPPAGGSVAIASVFAECGPPPSADTPGAPASCGAVNYNAQVRVNGRLGAGDTVVGGEGVIHLIGDYSSFQPGPGTLELLMSVRVPADRGGFAAVTASYVAGISVPVSWTR